MKEPKNYLKKAKNWNLVMLITSCISAVMGLVSIVGSFNDKLSNYSIYDNQAQIMFDYQTGLLYRGFLLLNFAILIFLIFRYFKANQLLGNDLLATKYPYYLSIGMMVLSFLFTQLTTPKVDLVEGLDLGMVTVLSNLVGIFIVAIPPIFTLVNLFKGETSEEA